MVALTFLTPGAALIALLGGVPLAVLVSTTAQARRIRARLGLPDPSASRAAVGAALVTVAALVGLAAAQPVVGQTRSVSVRADAEVIVLLDISRSMLASSGPSGRTRLDRARAEAIRLRTALPNVRVGLASFTDRTLPHLFPVADQELFRATAEQAIDIERPPPIALLRTGVTTLAALSSIALRHFYSDSARHRALVVLTDGESRPFDPASLSAALRRSRGIRPFFVHVWKQNERVYTDGRPEPDYRVDPRSGAQLAQIARAAKGRLFGEREVSAVAAAVREALGEGPMVAVTRSETERPIGQYVLLAAALPLAFLLVRLSR